MTVYSVLQCPKCGLHQSTAAETLKCKYCNKSTAIRSKKGHERVNIKAKTDNPSQAAELVRKLNEKMNKIS